MEAGQVVTNRLKPHFRAEACRSDSLSRRRCISIWHFLGSEARATRPRRAGDGAIAGGGVRVLNHALIDQLGLPITVVEWVTATDRFANRWRPSRWLFDGRIRGGGSLRGASLRVGSFSGGRFSGGSFTGGLSA